MAAPRETIWPLKPHSRGKHLVLKEYLKAWLPILGQTEGRILFLDGFAGPGEYEGGEKGSPIIALRAFLEHSARRNITAEVKFIFIEKKQDRADHLRRLVAPWESELPRGSDVQIVCGAFDETVARELDALAGAGKTLAPCFAMVDPFGVRDTPMHVLRRILTHPKSEVYVSVMYESIHRFDDADEFEAPLRSLYGCDDWKDCVEVPDAHGRRRCFLALYERQLREAGAEQVVRFDLYDGGRHKYSIFHASRHPLASDKMKAAIWSIDPGGNFVFRGGRTDQLLLGVDQPNFAPLREALRDRLRGKGWVQIEDIREFVMSDQTDYHSSQLRKQALIPMEEAGKIEVRQLGNENAQQAMIPGLLDDDVPPPRKVMNYPRGTELRITRTATGSRRITGG
ncbi:three-Cys-motif partner protein TcmP [Candidatus Palauibacter sp.]|uniref:three-Cys-motif partner protein TcmP n=1 Tax=Candidatus Palauibacter sp. TaxID=3101350 RepID=UPI003B0298DA